MRYVALMLALAACSAPLWVRGGALYDTWWPKDAPPQGDHPLWASRPDMTSNTRSGPDTWRCKECHGWDYRGANGAYGAGSHRTGFPSLTSRQGEAEIAALLRGAHGYGDLPEEDLRALVAFVVHSGALDTHPVVRDGKFVGDPAQGARLYHERIGGNDKACVTCHKATRDEPPAAAARANPWEFAHKVRFGHPGSPMPQSAGLTLPELGHLGAYLQSL
jgi:thiosulfate dehydrogenase